MDDGGRTTIHLDRRMRADDGVRADLMRRADHGARADDGWQWIGAWTICDAVRTDGRRVYAPTARDDDALRSAAYVTAAWCGLAGRVEGTTERTDGADDFDPGTDDGARTDDSVRLKRARTDDLARIDLRWRTTIQYRNDGACADDGALVPTTARTDDRLCARKWSAGARIDVSWNFGVRIWRRAHRTTARARIDGARYGRRRARDRRSLVRTTAPGRRRELRRADDGCQRRADGARNGSTAGRGLRDSGTDDGARTTRTTARQWIMSDDGALDDGARTGLTAHTDDLIKSTDRRRAYGIDGAQWTTARTDR
jgi:hypothetical protein